MHSPILPGPPTSYDRSRQPDTRTKRYFAAEPGVEFRGSVPLVSPDDPNQPIEFRDGFVRVFDLSNSDHLKDYNEVVMQIARGAAILCKEEVTFSEKTNNYVVFVRWMGRFYAMQDYDQKGLPGAESKPQPTPGQISI